MTEKDVEIAVAARLEQEAAKQDKQRREEMEQELAAALKEVCGHTMPVIVQIIFVFFTHAAGRPESQRGGTEAEDGQKDSGTESSAAGNALSGSLPFVITRVGLSNRFIGHRQSES
jgi:hypothetical protein